MYVKLFFLLLGLKFLAVSTHDNFDNSIVEEPLVRCGSDSIQVAFRTAKPFAGRLHVEGESERQGCSQTPPPTSERAEFAIRFGECNMRRQRTLNPRGVAYSFTLVASFHPLFVTGLDRAFHVRCFFTEAVKAVESSLDVHKLTTQLVEREFVLPQCSYQLRQGFGGPVLRFASVGDPVTHVWACDDLAGVVYGVLIHSCYVDDGHGNRFALLDDRGCAVDRFLLPDLAYDAAATTAHVDAHVFKYADRVQLFFTCTIQLCFKEDGGCDGITPPQCNRFPDSLSESVHGLRVPPGLHRRPLLPELTESASPDFPRPHLNPLHGRGEPEPTLERPHGRATPPHEDFFGAIRRGGHKPVNPAARKEAAGSPFGATGYELSPFGSPFKDSPLRNDTDASDSLLEDLANITEAHRSSRAAKQMESDLSVELTVMPIADTPSHFTVPSATADRSSSHCFPLAAVLAFALGSFTAVLLSSLGTALVLTRRRRTFHRKSAQPIP